MTHAYYGRYHSKLAISRSTDTELIGRLLSQLAPRGPYKVIWDTLVPDTLLVGRVGIPTTRTALYT